MYNPYQLVSLLLATNKVHLVIARDIESPYCDPRLKIIYLPESGYGLGSVLHEMAHLKYSQRLDNLGQQIVKRFSLSGLPTQIGCAISLALDDLVQAFEDVRIEKRLLDEYPGAIDPVADEYMPSTGKKPVPLPVKVLADMLRSRYYTINQLDIPIVHRINAEVPTLTQATTSKMVKDLLVNGMVEAWLTWVLDTKEALEYYTHQAQNKTQQRQMRAKVGKMMKALKGGLKLGNRKEATQKQAQLQASRVGGRVAKSIPGMSPGWGKTERTMAEAEAEQVTRQQMNSEIAPYIATLTATLRKMKAHGYTRTLVNQRKGKLDNARLSRIATGKSDKVFKKREIKKTNAQTAISVSIDRSGSMNNPGRIQNARLSAYLLAVAMQKAKRPVHITTFNQTVSTIKTWEDKHNWPVAISNVRANGDNADGDAVAESIKALSARHEMDKIIIMLTDGQVIQKTELKTQLAIAKRKGIRAVAIAIGENTVGYAKQYYSKVYEAPEAKDIPLAMAKLLKDEKLL